VPEDDALCLIDINKARYDRHEDALTSLDIFLPSLSAVINLKQLYNVTETWQDIANVSLFR
jgi:hypothetical protein